MPFSNEEQQIIIYGKQQGKNRDEILRALNNYKLGIKTSPVAEPSYAEKVKETALGGVQQIKQGISELATPPEVSSVGTTQQELGTGAAVAETIAQGTRAGARSVGSLGRVVGGALATAASPILPAVSSFISSLVPEGLKQSVSKYVQENPDKVKELEQYAQIANLAIAPATKALPSTTRSAIDVAKRNLPDIKIPEISNPLKVSQAKAFETARNELATTARKYSTARGVLDDAQNLGVDPIESIAQKDVLNALSELENGQIRTSEAINVLERQNATLANVRNDISFMSDVATPFSEYRQYVDDIIDSQQSWTQAKRDATKARVSKVLDDYEKTYGKAPLSVTELEKIKTEQTGLSKTYKNTDAFQYDTHSIIGKASRDLAKQITDEDGVSAGLNKLMTQNYNAIELLEKLDGKTPHGGRFTKVLTQTAGTVAGGIAGATGGVPQAIIGALSGRFGASFADDFLNSNLISNPYKRYVINQLLADQPAVLKNAQKWLDENLPDISELGDTTLVNSVQLKK